MNRWYNDKLRTLREELQASNVELEELEQQIRSFESLVDARLGDLLDQLSELNAETITLDGKLRHIRERRLFGANLIRYLDGAPRPPRPLNLNDLPPPGLTNRNPIHATANGTSPSHAQQTPDIKTLYRKLAHRHHPDLARNDADRLHSNEQMAEINQAYNAGDLSALMRLAGMTVSYGVDIHLSPAQPEALRHGSLTEVEQLEKMLKTVRQQIDQLSCLPIVKLSLEVKLKWRQGHDLLYEMATGLRYKVERKIAERDYLRAQINASGETEMPGDGQ